jgi:hypothetical protein
MGPQGPEGVGAVIVVDAIGQRVGALQSVSAIFVSAGGVTSLVLTDRNGFTPSGTFTFYYLTPDCSDAPYVPASTRLIPTGVVANGLLWFALNTVPGRDLAVGDPVFVRTNLGIDACTAATANTAMKLYPAQSYNLSTFVPPFRIE